MRREYDLEPALRIADDEVFQAEKGLCLLSLARLRMESGSRVDSRSAAALLTECGHVAQYEPARRTELTAWGDGDDPPSQHTRRQDIRATYGWLAGPASHARIAGKSAERGSVRPAAAPNASP